MDIRKLNEYLDKILNEERKLIPDLIAKYGDLTIPEFIDALIQKGEDVLDESINEDIMSWDDLQNKLFTELRKKIAKIKIPQLKVADSYTNRGSKVYENIKFDFDQTYYNNVISGRTNVSMQDSAGYGSIETTYNGSVFKIGLYNIKKDGAVDPYRKTLQVTIGFPIGNANTPNGVLNNWDKFRCRLDDGIGTCWELIIDIEDFKLNSIIKDIISFFYSRYEAQVQKNREEEEKKKIAFDSATNEFEELAKARREARANKNAANTTIKQALSKSSVAKKIQALQNPTPEQLAKILAAIEG